MYQRPYVIVNGKPSYGIRGLLVVNLPPIHKPSMRNETETIDGRDGDIVTTLGYEAYDKSFDIGLHGDYDVDKVIEYFATSGTITFSNEADKEYRFQQMDEIDFEKLVRYRTATVKIHVQPYKYSRLARPKTWTLSGSSNTVTVRNDGNVEARPTLTITGSGSISVMVDGVKVLDVELASKQTIIIDVAGMEAKATDGILLNRKVSGDYAALSLRKGTTRLGLTGSVTEFSIADYSRWI